MKILNVCTTIFLFVFLFVGTQFALGQDFPPEELEMPPEESQMPGRTEGTGTHFEVTDSEYLNITLDSTDEVTLTLESIPQMVTMHIESASGAAYTTITLAGFSPTTTYYKYEDDYHNLAAMITDGNGSYSFIQDISAPHLVFIQPQPGTKFIPGDTSIGTWDPVSRIYTLTTDVSEAIQIDEGSLTLDGAGHTITGPGTGSGVYLNGKTGVRIQNVSVSGFANGILLNSSSSNTLVGNTISDNNVGIYLAHSSDGNAIVGNAVNLNSAYGIWVLSSSNNNLTDNTVNSNWHAGIYLQNSNDSTLNGNTTDSNTNTGIALEYSSSNVLSDNVAQGGSTGIRLGFSNNDNVLTGNTTSGSYSGIRLYGSSNGNTLTNNTADSCGHIAIALSDCNNNTLTGNTASNSPWGITLSQSNNNTLTGNTADSNRMGITFYGSGNNTLTGNIASNTERDGGLYGYGIWLVGAGTENNIFTGNTLSNNISGFEIHYSTVANILTGNTFSNNVEFGVRLAGNTADNQVYNNNFIDNGIQAQVYLATGSVFSQPSPVGGNYWSDHTGPDSNGDGFVDSPYIFTGGQDDLPWVLQDGWSPTQAIENLTTIIDDMELQQGVDNSLGAKLETIQESLLAANDDIRNDAINKLEAFINAVEAQRGKKLTDAQADQLVNAANNIIATLGGAAAAPALARFIIAESQLDQNYPNPFNPETWIPYQLREGADVTVSIYSATGQLVRRLDLGYRNAGSYTSMEKAVHWDGTNEHGERVSSGLYFYTIQAGEFVATKKMIIAE